MARMVGRCWDPPQTWTFKSKPSYPSALVGQASQFPVLDGFGWAGFDRGKAGSGDPHPTNSSPEAYPESAEKE